MIAANAIRMNAIHRCLLAAMAGTVLLAASEGLRLHGVQYDPPRRAPDIRAQDYNDQPWVLSRQPHPLMLVMFGYVNCTDVCPGSLIRMKRIQDALGARRDQVLFVFVTVDPEYETPAMMKDRLSYYQGEIVGITGTLEQLSPAWMGWNIERSRRPIDPSLDPTGRGFAINHTAQMFLVQGGKTLRCSYPYGVEAPEITADIEALLDQPDAPPTLPPAQATFVYRLPPMAYTLEFARNPTVPTYIRLATGGSIHWVNDDYMDHAIGDIYLSPGDRAWQHFPASGDFYYLCTATPGEALRITVQEPSPTTAD